MKDLEKVYDWVDTYIQTQAAKQAYKLPPPKVRFSHPPHTPDPWFADIPKPVGCVDCLDELPGWIMGFRGYYPCTCHPNPPAEGSVFTREEIEQWDA